MDRSTINNCDPCDYCVMAYSEVIKINRFLYHKNPTEYWFSKHGVELYDIQVVTRQRDLNGTQK